MSAIESAKETAAAGAKTVKRMFRNTSEFVSELTLKQALIIAGGTLLVVIVFSNLLIGFWQKYLPSMLITLIKFMIYILVPLVAVGGVVFGMWLEQRYQKFEDLSQWVSDKFAQANESIASIKKKM